MIIGYSLVGCTSSSPEDPAIDPTTTSNRTLLGGLWVPLHVSNTPYLWLIDTQLNSVIAITDDQYAVKRPLTPAEDGTWKTPALREAFSMTKQPHTLMTTTSTDTIVYEKLLEKTRFDFPATVLEDLKPLLQVTGLWKTREGSQHIAFYTPSCPTLFKHQYQAFNKAALVFKNVPKGNDTPSDYRQLLSFHYHAGILYFFMDQEGYVVIQIQAQQWTLRALTPPYSTVVWERVDQPSPDLKTWINIHEKRLEKERSLNLIDCP